MSTKERVIRIVSQAAGLAPDALSSNRELIEYGVDSARAMEIVAELEDGFEVEIDEDDVAAMRTIDDIVAVLARLGVS